MNAAELRNLYVRYLSQEGYKPSVDSDGDVVFKVEGGTYYIDVDETDQEFFRIVYPNFWSLDNDREFADALVAADYATKTCKVTKVYLRPDGRDVSASIELFLDRPENFRYVFSRSMRALKHGVGLFVEKMS